MIFLVSILKNAYLVRKLSTRKKRAADELLCYVKRCKIIKIKIDEFTEWLDLTFIDPTIQSLNSKCIEIKEDTLEYIFRKIDLNQREQKIIDKMLGSALKRVIREPIINLKQVKNKGQREEYIKVIEDLFEI